MSESTALITIAQLPVIEEQLKALKDSWEQRAADASSMVCTEETVQDLKKIRADMRKEFDEADKQRKAAKLKYMEPWNSIEETFKECVTDAYKRADASMKDTISAFEDEIKAKCRVELEAYFKELCAMDHIDFLTFDEAMKAGGIKISLTDAKKATPRQAMDQLGKFVSSIAIGMDQISQMDDSAAIMAEYKKCLDVGKAVSVVQERKRREAEEQKAAEARKAAQEAEAAAVEKVQAAAPTKAVAAPQAVKAQPQEQTFPQFTFTVFNCTRSQLLEIRDYLRQKGIQYK